MRAHETIDVTDIHNEEIRQFLISDPESFKLFKNQTALQEFTSFLESHIIVTNPQLNDQFTVTNIKTIPIIKFGSIGNISLSTPLIKMHNGFYHFQPNDQEIKFPIDTSTRPDQLQFTLLFRTTAEQAQFLTLLHLKFADWRFTSKELV